jgi:hypothetical protein
VVRWVCCSASPFNLVVALPYPLRHPSKLSPCLCCGCLAFSFAHRRCKGRFGWSQLCRLTLLLRWLLVGWSSCLGHGWSSFLVAPSPACLGLFVVGGFFVVLILAQFCWDLQTQSFHIYIGGFGVALTVVFVFTALLFVSFLCVLFLFLLYCLLLLCVLDQRWCGIFRSFWFGFINPFGSVLLTR